MATSVYQSGIVHLIDGRELEITPLKIKYLKEFMIAFEFVKQAKDDEEAIAYLAECARITMKQFCPEIKTIEDLEDNIDMPTVYQVLEMATGIKIKPDEAEPVKEQAKEGGATWEDLDLAKLESELFLLGIWKDYEDLETSLSMPELSVSLEAKRESDYQEKKFLAAIQGIDLDKQTGKDESNAWEEMKARVFSGGASSDPNDVLSLQGQNAAKAGFGIGMGLSYERIS